MLTLQWQVNHWRADRWHSRRVSMLRHHFPSPDYLGLLYLPIFFSFSPNAESGLRLVEYKVSPTLIFCYLEIHLSEISSSKKQPSYSRMPGHFFHNINLWIAQSCSWKLSEIQRMYNLCSHSPTVRQSKAKWNSGDVCPSATAVPQSCSWKLSEIEKMCK